jgi:hypothetical protein
MDVIDRLSQLGARAAYFKQALRDKLIDHLRLSSRRTRGLTDNTSMVHGDRESTAPLQQHGRKHAGVANVYM